MTRHLARLLLAALAAAAVLDLLRAWRRPVVVEPFDEPGGGW